MRYLCLLYILLFLTYCNTFAVPAYPKRIKIAVEDGFVYITIHGDENTKYGTTDDGYTIMQHNNAWYYVCKNCKGEISLSEYKLKKTRNSEINEFLQKTDKGLKPVTNKATQLKYKTQTRSLSNSIFAVGKTSAIGERRALVILMQFTDKKFIKSRYEFEALFNQEGYNEDGADGSVHDYYNTVSQGNLKLSCDIVGPFTSKNGTSYYGSNSGIGGNDIRPFELFKEAIDEATKNINLANYDYNQDGYVDNIHIIYAGHGEEAGGSSNSIWAHEMTFEPITVENMLIDRYSCSPELRKNSGFGITRIGVICHEIGHSLGAMDYYDTDYQDNGYFEGTGEWDIMASGSWNNEGITPADFNPYVKAFNFGWIDVYDLEQETQSIIYPSYNTNYIYKIDTPNQDEFYLLENIRAKNYNRYTPGEGLLIFHISADIEKETITNTINAGYPQSCYPVCASSIYTKPNSSSLSYGDINSAGCPYPGTSNNREFSNTSTPATLCNNGNKSGITITEIREDENGNIILYHTLEKDVNIRPFDIIWEEDFEQTSLSASWIQEDIYGKCEWSIRNASSNLNSNQYPNAVKGDRFLCLAQNIKTFAKQRCSGKITSEKIKIANSGKYALNMYCRKYNKDYSSTDTLSIYIRKEKSEWKKRYSTAVTHMDKWEELLIEYETTPTNIEIAIEGNISSGSNIFIDAISIIPIEIQTNIIDSKNELQVEERKIYNLKGERITEISKPGIYILNGEKMLIK